MKRPRRSGDHPTGSTSSRDDLPNIQAVHNAQLLAGEQRAQRLKCSSTTACRFEMSRPPPLLAFPNHLPHPSDCPGAARASVASNPMASEPCAVMRMQMQAPEATCRPAQRERTASPPLTRTYPTDCRASASNGLHLRRWRRGCSALWSHMYAPALHCWYGRAEEANFAALMLVGARILRPGPPPTLFMMTPCMPCRCRLVMQHTHGKSTRAPPSCAPA